MKLKSTAIRHKTILETFNKFLKETGSKNEAVKLTEAKTGYAISYINKIRYAQKKKQKAEAI